MGLLFIGGIIAAWMTMWPIGAVLTGLAIIGLLWMRDRMRHEREFGSDASRDGPPPRDPEEARRRNIGGWYF